MASIFSKIIEGIIPCEKLYESNASIAFLDIAPCAQGHTLVVSKREVPRLENLTVIEATQLMQDLQLIAAAVSRAYQGADYNIILNNGPHAGQEVPHVHFHIIPRFPGSSAPFKQRLKYGEGQMSSVGEKIREALKNTSL